MEQQTEKKQKVKVYYDRRLLPLAPKSRNTERLFIECGGNECYRVTVKPVADWYVINGKVDSKRTHDIVLSMVQTNHPYRELVDHLTVVNPEA
ncbi:MAG: hypothetical protein JXX14_14950 [Deltaproteobacteria bacterium]|nr:hypothetical protein [Deltaproteobacteria bacterium]